MSDTDKPETETPEATEPTSNGVRLQKLLADAGEGSRRGLEKRITDGHVRLNGEVATIGATAKKGDLVTLGQSEYRVISKGAFHRSIVYNKPLGEITTRHDPEGRPTVFDNLPPVKGGRWVAVGRLDINTTGLLLMTTDGELANAMMHPSNRVDREYACRVFGEVDQLMIDRLKEGVELEDGPASFGDIVDSGGEGENRWYHVTLLEGRNREVRRLWDSQGVKVSRLKRVRYGAVFLPRRLRMGEWSELALRDHKVLREDVGLPASSDQQLSLRPLNAPKRGGRGGQRDSRNRSDNTRSRKPRKHAKKARPSPKREAANALSHSTSKKDSARKPAPKTASKPASKPARPAGKPAKPGSGRDNKKGSSVWGKKS